MGKYWDNIAIIEWLKSECIKLDLTYLVDDVVDANLKLFNTNNLYIIGSSIFRTGGHANPTLTIVQLSLRLAEHLSLNSKS